MSLILEALRKSEAERRRGQTPDLLADAVLPAAANANSRPAPTRPWLLAGAAATAAVAAVLWWRSHQDGTELRPAPSTAPVAAATPAAPPVQPASNALPPLRPPRSAITMRSAAARPAPASVRAESVREAAVAPARAPATDTAAVPPQAATSPPAPPLATATRPSATGTPATGASDPATPTVAFTSATVPMRLSELSGDERSQLPSMKISMHMWAPNPADRFVIIDGARVGEGDRVGEATVQSILADGVMLSWRGRQIRLPIR